jgi:hypothetical protein
MNTEIAEIRDGLARDIHDEALLARLRAFPDEFQIRKNREDTPCHFSTLVLSRQPDFAGQTSGIQEVFDAFNLKHGLNYICLFLPKFHPELNFIERCWSQLKYYVKALSSGTIEQLLCSIGETPPTESPDAGTKLGKAWDFVSIDKVRGFSRTCWHYCMAYQQRLSIVEANYYIKKFRRHRCYTKSADLSMDRYMTTDAELQATMATQSRTGAAEEAERIANDDLEGNG